MKHNIDLFHRRVLDRIDSIEYHTGKIREQIEGLEYNYPVFCFPNILKKIAEEETKYLLLDISDKTDRELLEAFTGQKIKKDFLKYNKIIFCVETQKMQFLSNSSPLQKELFWKQEDLTTTRNLLQLSKYKGDVVTCYHGMDKIVKRTDNVGLELLVQTTNIKQELNNLIDCIAKELSDFILPQK